MKHNTRLYISGKLVDCSETLSLPITYSLEDLSNPTIVKNSFSKTITVPATPNNNKIFGEFYKLDRMQHYEEWTGNPQLNGINFDPSKRADFAIYVNGEIVESGYCQLNDVSVENEIKAYNITLYGGLGDFFYNLKYNEDGTTKTLADLRYFIRNNKGVLQPKETEMDFTISKDFVDECYSKTWNTEGSRLTDTITFIPANNGIYEKFDSSHCLINTNGDFVFPKKYVDKSDPNNPKDFTPLNGYALASLEKDYTEWEMRDLRSYQQRPAIKLSKLIESICNKENSGYNVTFDPSFFNEKNPYWSKSFVALPLLGTTSEDAATKFNGTSTSADPVIGYRTTSSATLHSQVNVDVSGQGISTTSHIIDMSSYPVASTFNLEYDFSLSARPIQTTDSDYLYISSQRYYQVGREPHYRDYAQAITAQVIAYDAESNDMLGFSDLYYFSNSFGGSRGQSDTSATSPDNWINYEARTDAAKVPVVGQFRKQSGAYYFQTNTGDNTFKLTLSKVPRADKVKIVFYVDWQKENASSTNKLYRSRITASDADEAGIAAYETFETLDNKQSFEISYENPVLSGAKVTKEMLLKTENSPADFLLSFSKIFGLYYVKDVNSKEITIYSRRNYFIPKVNNWDTRIDKSKNMTITPILFDKKWYLMSLDTPETYFATKYKSKYNMTYGQKRLNTGYNFNSETTKLYDENIYQNIVTAVDSDKYFRSFYNRQLRPIPSFMNDNITYSLYNGSDTYNQDLYGISYIDTGKTVEWSSLGRDLFAKQCFFSLSSDEKDLEEVSSSLVLYNGTVDLLDSSGIPVKFWLTDDLREMSTLNDGEMCYLYTTSEYDENGNQIAIARTSLPQYISYTTKSNGSVEYSLDFGLPKEIYSDYSYNENATIYNLFWKDFYADQFDINTKKVTCYVRLDDLKVNNDMLREFYFFDNGYWILNKIDSYDVNSTGTVRCEFIKVQDIAHYRSTPQFYSGINIEIANTISNTGGTLTGKIYCADSWEFSGSIQVNYSDGTKGVLTTSDFISPIRGNGDGTFTFRVPNNSSNATAVYTLTVTSNGAVASTVVTQDGKSMQYRFLNLDQNYCLSCGLCEGLLKVCPVGLTLEYDGVYPEIQNLSSCIACGACIPEVCPMYGEALLHSDTASDMIYADGKSVSITPSNYTFESAGGSYQFIITYRGRQSDTNVSVTTTNPWLTVSNIVWDSTTSETGKITVTATKNADTTPRTGSFVVASTTSKFPSKTVTVTQKASEAPAPTDYTIYITKTDGSVITMTNSGNILADYWAYYYAKKEVPLDQIKSVSFGSGINSFGVCIFYGATNLESIYFNAPSATFKITADDATTDDMPKYGDYYYPCDQGDYSSVTSMFEARKPYWDAHCLSEPGPGPEPTDKYLTIDKNVITIEDTGTGASDVVNISSNTDWTVDINDN